MPESSRRTCKGCNGALPIGARTNRVWCSERCRLRAYRLRCSGEIKEREARVRKEVRLNRAQTIAELNCLSCGKLAGRKVNGFPRKYCSKQCKDRHWRRSNKERVNLSQKKRYELKSRVSCGSITRLAVLERDSWVCYICNQEIPRDADLRSSDYGTIDHIMPISRGGADEWSNVAAAHWGCNSSKGAKTLEEYCRGE